MTIPRAKREWWKLIARVQAGEEVTIYRGGRPLVKLTPCPNSPVKKGKRPKVGAITSAPIKYAKDCFKLSR